MTTGERVRSPFLVAAADSFGMLTPFRTSAGLWVCIGERTTRTVKNPPQSVREGRSPYHPDMARRTDKQAQDDPLRDASRGVRIQKALAEAGVASRRRCEELIEEGRVVVNGRLVSELPAWVDLEQDEIVVDGKRIGGAERHVYIMLNKPRATVSTADDPDGRRTVLDLVDHPAAGRLFPVGRLDYDTLGLILLTNDGELANRLTHPRYGVHKTYLATVKGRIEEGDIAALEEGIFLAERKEGQTVGARRTARVRLKIVSKDKDRTVLELTLGEGRNRQVRRMMAAVGHPVRKLVRIRMGPLSLKGLARGEWRELTRQEIGRLRRAGGRKADSGTGRGKGARGKRPTKSQA